MAIMGNPSHIFDQSIVYSLNTGVDRSYLFHAISPESKTKRLLALYTTGNQSLSRENLRTTNFQLQLTIHCLINQAFIPDLPTGGNPIPHSSDRNPTANLEYLSQKNPSSSRAGTMRSRHGFPLTYIHVPSPMQAKPGSQQPELPPRASRSPFCRRTRRLGLGNGPEQPIDDPCLFSS